MPGTPEQVKRGNTRDMSSHKDRVPVQSECGSMAEHLHGGGIVACECVCRGSSGSSCKQRGPCRVLCGGDASARLKEHRDMPIGAVPERSAGSLPERVRGGCDDLRE